MLKKISLLIACLLFGGCSVTFIYVEKNMYIQGDDNKLEQSGAELKGNQATQGASGQLEVPLIP